MTVLTSMKGDQVLGYRFFEVVRVRARVMHATATLNGHNSDTGHG